MREATSTDLCVNEMTQETWDGIEGRAGHSIPPVLNLEDKHHPEKSRSVSAQHGLSALLSTLGFIFTVG